MQGHVAGTLSRHAMPELIGVATNQGIERRPDLEGADGRQCLELEEYPLIGRPRSVRGSSVRGSQTLGRSPGRDNLVRCRALRQRHPETAFRLPARAT